VRALIAWLSPGHNGRLAALRGWRADLAAIVIGLASALALPPVFMLPVLAVTFPLLLALIDASPRGAIAARRGFWFGFGLHLIGLYWITEAILIEAARYWWLVPLAVPALSAVLAVFIALPCWVAWRAPRGWPRLLALAGAWVLGDLARQFVGTGFPWNLLGSVWEFPGRAGDLFLQPAALVSLHGMTLATLLLAGLPWLGRRAALLIVPGVVLWAGIGFALLQRTPSTAPNLAVVLVQGNVPEGEKRDRAAMVDVFRRHLALSAQGVAQAGNRPSVVVWPESMSPFLLQQDANARAAIAAAAAGPDSRPSLIGTVRFDEQGQPRNSLVAINGAGPVLALYDKWHLVPFGEYAPSWVPLAIQMVPGGGFGFGDGPHTLHVPGLPPVAPMICYEVIFPAQVVDEHDRPDWMVNVTNDAWFGTSSGPRQHLAAARARAVEEGLPLLRAANTGITVGFDAFGHQIGRLPQETAGVLVLDLPGRLPATPFARLGLLLPGVLAALSLALGLARGRRLR